MLAMRKITIAALLLAGLAIPVHAQQQKPPDPEDVAKARDAAALDKKYKTILKLTDKPTDVKVDPWRNMRASSGTDASKPEH